jgi:anti-sigma factor RsiW
VTSCERPDLKERLYRHVRGEIEDPQQRRELEAHIQECAECRGIFQELQWVLGSLRPTTPDEHEQLMRELRRTDADAERVPVGAGGTTGSSGQGVSGLLRRLGRWLSSGGASSSPRGPSGRD